MRCVRVCERVCERERERERESEDGLVGGFKGISTLLATFVCTKFHFQMWTITLTQLNTYTCHAVKWPYS